MKILAILTLLLNMALFGYWFYVGNAVLVAVCASAVCASAGMALVRMFKGY